LRGPGAHIRQLVLSDRGGSSLGIQTISCQKPNERKKILSLGRARESLYLNPRRKKLSYSRIFSILVDELSLE